MTDSGITTSVSLLFAKASLPIAATELPNKTLVNSLPPKAFDSISVTESGMTISLRLLPPKPPREVTESGITTSARPFPKKASYPIVTTASPTITLVKLLSLNALSPTDLIESERIISLRLHPKKAPSPIKTIESGIKTL